MGSSDSSGANDVGGEPLSPQQRSARSFGLTELKLKVLKPWATTERTEALLAEVEGFLQPMLVRALVPALAADATTAEAFVKVAQALVAVRHSALLTPRAVGQLPDGRPYVVTEVAEPLATAPFAARSASLERVVEQGLPLAHGLQALHRAELAAPMHVEEHLMAFRGGVVLDVALVGLDAEHSTPSKDVSALARLMVDALAEEGERASFTTSLKKALAGEATAEALAQRLGVLRHRWSHLPADAPLPAVESVSVEEPDLSGQPLGGYHVESLLGEGAVGRVYRARHVSSGQSVALKVLKVEHGKNKDVMQRFVQEAAAVNAIKHEHIVAVLDFGESATAHGQRTFCAMNLLDGQNLADRLEQAPLDIKFIATVGQQVARALGAAHEVGVVHRDIKPENVFLQRSDTGAVNVKLLDFGMAKLLKPLGALPRVGTQAGTIIGTPEYMAPEQALGHATDARTDLYALGLVLYEALGRRPPFVASSFGALVAEITAKPVPALPSTTAAGEPIPPALAQLVMRCLAKAPEHRFQSAAELDAALEPFATGAWAAAAPASPAPRARPASKQRWVVAAAAGVAAVVASGWLWLQKHARPAGSGHDGQPNAARSTEHGHRD